MRRVKILISCPPEDKNHFWSSIFKANIILILIKLRTNCAHLHWVFKNDTPPNISKNDIPLAICINATNKSTHIKLWFSNKIFCFLKIIPNQTMYKMTFPLKVCHLPLPPSLKICFKKIEYSIRKVIDGFICGIYNNRKGPGLSFIQTYIVGVILINLKGG